MSAYLQGHMPIIQGLQLPTHTQEHEQLLDTEYSDDTMLTIAFLQLMLDRLRHALKVFCLASGARINWNKSHGIPIGSDGSIEWGRLEGFTWLASGQTCRTWALRLALMFHCLQQFDLVLTSIKKKLIHWSCCHLSLIGRALVVNKVPLSTTWCIASCWLLHFGVLARLKHLLQNFSWERSNGA